MNEWLTKAEQAVRPGLPNSAPRTPAEGNIPDFTGRTSPSIGQPAAPAADCPPLAAGIRCRLCKKSQDEKSPLARACEGILKTHSRISNFVCARVRSPAAMPSRSRISSHQIGQTFAFCTIGAVESPFGANFQEEDEYARQAPKKQVVIASGN